jgi:radical SAM protein with 4Fe4S-binding SPASM domain
MTLMEEISRKAMALGVPLQAHLDLTYRCNERCEHCYLEHDDKGEMNFEEICALLDQLAEAGVFFLTLSGGEPLLRRDFFDIVAQARALLFNVKLKTNAVLIRTPEAQRLRALGVEQVNVSVYSHRAEIHDAVTKLPGSLRRTLEGIRALRATGMKVTVANVMMRSNLADNRAVAAMARELGASYIADPTITPMMNGDRGVLSLRIPGQALPALFQDPELVGDPTEFCAPPAPVTEGELNGLPCSAGHTSCYISPYGDVFPCVQFPLPSGNVRRQKFLDIWKHSPALAEVRSIRTRDLPVCSGCSHVATCTRCPGQAWVEGNMRGPSTADCEKSFYRTGIPSANMLARGWRPAENDAFWSGASRSAGLVQIAPLPHPAA